MIFNNKKNTLSLCYSFLVWKRLVCKDRWQGYVEFIRYFSEKLKGGNVIPKSLQESGIAFIPTGGDENRKTWKTL